MTAPVGPDPLHAVLDAACGIDGADEVEAWASHRWGGLTRFARSSIHQHVESEDTTVSVRAVVGAMLDAIRVPGAIWCSPSRFSSGSPSALLWSRPVPGIAVPDR